MSADIRSRVRSIITSRWLDANQVNIMCGSNGVRLRGTLEKVPGSQGRQLTGNAIEALESEIRQIKGVKHVYMDFSNWTRTGAGGWLPKNP